MTIESNVIVRRFGLLLGITFLAVMATAQTQHYSDPGIVIPKSSIVKPGSHAPVTYYLKYKGLPQGHPYVGLKNPFWNPWSTLNGTPASSTIQGFYPSDIRTSYNMPPFGGGGAIAIVDLNNLSSSLADFNTFAQQFGLPQETSTDETLMSNKVFTKVYAEGTKPPDDDTGWGGEIALDIEWTHAMAPNAKIYLVESNNDLNAANQVAASLPGVQQVSNSWGYPGEVPTEQQWDSNYLHKGVVFFASSGDIGSLQSYPAESPNVVGVGGTSLFMSNGGYTLETGWNDAGGGPSLYEPRPDYQEIVKATVGSSRGCPDVAAVADPNTGVAVFSNTAYGSGPTWIVIGGTSVACPVMAGMTNTRQNWTSSSHRELERIYFNLGGSYYRDILAGSSGTWSASKGWDYVTGIGTPKSLFAPPLAFNIVPLMAAPAQGSQVSGTLKSLYQIDGNSYGMRSLATREGQSAAAEVGVKLTGDPSTFTTSSISFVTTAPLGTTIQIFEKNWKTGNYDYIRAFGSSGKSQQNTMAVLPGYVQAGTREVDMIFRALRPTAIASSAFVFSMDQVLLSEVVTPLWDVNQPL